MWSIAMPDPWSAFPHEVRFGREIVARFADERDALLFVAARVKAAKDAAPDTQPQRKEML